MRIPLAPGSRERVKKALDRVERQLAEIEELMEPPVTGIQMTELKMLKREGLEMKATFEDWLANGMDVLPLLMLLHGVGKGRPDGETRKQAD
jgi:hypothetical protein